MSIVSAAYHFLEMCPTKPTVPVPKLPLDAALLKPGLRLAVGLSGGADSVALLVALAERSRELGLVLHAAHLHHGLRGDEADADLGFVRELTARLGLPFHEARVDTEAEARANKTTSKAAESIEEAARRLRYRWFRRLMSEIPLDAVATAHNLDDQAETVLAKFLRGAWTEGLSGIHPKLENPEGGRIIRPLLATTRAEVEAYLGALGQAWREDSTNRQLTFTRNRIRHELLPLLETWNPRLRAHLAQMALLARDEEAWWQTELDRIAAQLLLPGRPVRGGGRAASGGLALDVTRFAALAPALQRRLLRHAAEQLGAAPDFAATEALRKLTLAGRAGQRLELEHGLRAERTPREIRMSAAGTARAVRLSSEYTVEVPGEILALAYGLRLKIEVSKPFGQLAADPQRMVKLRNWKPGDKVKLRHTAGPHKIKEVLERLKVTGGDRDVWPVLEFGDRIVWMRGVELEPEPGLTIVASLLNKEGQETAKNAKSGPK